jgi:glucose/mannose-6-phosphate isomerase
VTVDTLDFLAAVRGLPEQLSAAHDAAGEIDPSRFPAGAGVDNVLVLGMGGSGISGDVLAATAQLAVPVPITVAKGYELPAFVGPRTLVFAMSYSGGTEETETSTAAALHAGAQVVVVSKGGALGALAAAHGALHVPCVDGYLPRAALGTLVAPLFVAFSRMGLLPEAHSWLVEAQLQLARRRDQCAPEVLGAANPARELARRIGRTIPLMYGGGAIGAVAAYRWKCDVNENAKAPAFASSYPELDHNEICGWGQHGDVTRQLISLVELRHDYEHPQTQRRFSITREIIDEALVQVLSVAAQGEGPLAQLLDLMYFGDWVSCYLALDNDVDPGPIDAIFTLKDALAQ